MKMVNTESVISEEENKQDSISLDVQIQKVLEKIEERNLLEVSKAMFMLWVLIFYQIRNMNINIMAVFTIQP